MKLKFLMINFQLKTSVYRPVLQWPSMPVLCSVAEYIPSDFDRVYLGNKFIRYIYQPLTTQWYVSNFITTLRPKQYARHFANDRLKFLVTYMTCECFYHNVTEIFLWGLINNITTLVQIIAWHALGDKSLSEPTLAYFTDEYMHLPLSVS